jgi:glycosyltransferase involved in cell wall biosynthesis
MHHSSGEPLRLLIIVNRLFEWSQNFITRELTELDRQGVQLYVSARKIVSRDDLSPREKKLPGKYIPIPGNPFTPSDLVKHFKFALRNPRAYGRAWKALFTLKHNRFSKFFRGIICLFRAAAIAGGAVSKKINLIHAHFLTAPAETALYLSKLTGIPYGGTGYAMDLYVDNSGLNGKIDEAAYINANTGANEHFLKSLDISDPAKIFKIHSGIEVLPALAEYVPPHPFRFIAVGRLVPKKGFRYLVEACNLLKQQRLLFHCDIIGKGPLEGELKAQIEELGLDSVISLIGYVAPNDMASYYKRSNLLVAPCIIDAAGDRDGLPNVFLEAMNFGLPIIAGNVSGIAEGVIAGKNGWLVPPSDVGKLAAAMHEAITHQDFQKLREGARSVMLEKFDLEKNMRELRGVFEKYSV